MPASTSGLRGALVSGLLVLLVAAALVPAGAQGAPSVLRQFCEGTQADPAVGLGGHCFIPHGVAIDPATGDAYVADGGNARVQKFTAWGQFLRAWGWDVVASGPDDNGTGFEVCVAANGDVCKEGQESSAAGGFRSPRGIAVDSTGNVYVTDLNNRRVQKFSSDGEFLLMFGGDVNRTKVEAAAPEAQRNLCPVDPGDVCQGGTAGTGNGQFSGLGQSGVPTSPAHIAASPDGSTVYVGDVDRIQKFDTAGHYTAQIALPEAGTVGALAADPKSGDLYFAYERKLVVNQPAQPGVHRLNPVTGEEIGTPLDVQSPVALTADAAGSVYAFQQENHHGNPPPHFDTEIFKFDLTGKLIERFGKGEFHSDFLFTFNNGIAASNACGIKGTDLFVSFGESGGATLSFIRLYGPPPDINVCPPPQVPPTISESYAVSVSTDGALVRATINPHFWNDATYFVQYATSQCIDEGGWEAPCVREQPGAPGTLLSEEVFDAERTTKGVFLGADQPLTSNTEYDYRFVAQSSGGGPVRGVGGVIGTDGEERTFRTFPLPTQPKEDCANQAFRTGASANLPDCRAYEMVSPVEKNSGTLAWPRFEVIDQASSVGGAITFAADGANAFGEPDSGPLAHQYMAERDPANGWSTRSIAAPRRSYPLFFGGNLITPYRYFSEDLCNGWLVQDTTTALAEGAPQGVPNLYRRQGLHAGCSEGGYELLTSVFPPGFDPEVENAQSEYRPVIGGFSADGSLSVFAANAALTEDASKALTTGTPKLGIHQLYAVREGAVHLISVLPDGKAAGTASALGTHQQVSASIVFPFFEDSVYNAVSADGSRVFWTNTASKDGEGYGPGKVYLRLNPTQPQSKISKGQCSEAERACTIAVSAEAEALSKTSSARYLSATPDGSVAIIAAGEDLYEFDTEKAIAGEPATTLIAHGAQGILGTSTDASLIYLASSEALSPGATKGEPNLYLYRRGTGFSFITVISSPSFQAARPWSQIPSQRIARVSPDGMHAAFASTDPVLAESVAGYDNTDVASGQPDQEVYLYDATANGGEGELACASCNPSGARPAGRLVSGENKTPGVSVWTAAAIRGWPSALHPSRYLSSEGGLFFESFEALVPRDTNGKGDVYEWERAESKEECLGAIGGEVFVSRGSGCLALISSGKGAEDSEFVDASADGSDVFILTQSSLLPQDISAPDIYDARVDGGFPPPPPIQPECEGEACQPPASPPNDQTPASSSYEGAGNVHEEGKAAKPRCPKGKHRVKARKGKSRCASTRKTHKRAANDERRAGR